MKYIITGTGRCGTVNLANVLTRCGIPCGHERIFNPHKLNIDSFVAHADPNFLHHEDIEADSSYLAAPYLFSYQKSQIIHVVRYPIDVLHSFLCNLCYFRYDKNPVDVYEKYILKHLPELRDIESPIDKACFFYVQWNKMIEKNSVMYYRHKIEDELDGIYDILGFKGKINYYDKKCNAWERWSTYTGNSSYDDFSYESLVQSKFFNDLDKMAKNYGYSIKKFKCNQVFQNNEMFDRLKGNWSLKINDGPKVIVSFKSNGRIKHSEMAEINTWNIIDNKLNINILMVDGRFICQNNGKEIIGINNSGDIIRLVKNILI